MGQEKVLWVRKLPSSQSYWVWRCFFLQWANEMQRDRFGPLIKALFSLFRIGIEWWDRQGQRRLAINLFNNFLLSDGLSSPQVFAVSLQRFTFDVASQTQLGGNLSVVSLIIASEWAGRLVAFRRFLSKNTDSSDIICICFSVQTVKQVDSYLTRYLLKVFSHSSRVSCFPLTNTPWPANQRNAISDARPSVREPLYSFPVMISTAAEALRVTYLVLRFALMLNLLSALQAM